MVSLNGSVTIGMGSELVSCMPGFIASMFDVVCKSAKKHTSLQDERMQCSKKHWTRESKRRKMRQKLLAQESKKWTTKLQIRLAQKNTTK